ncbi:MAG: Gfo/Idh/MocA family oxidoreductase [Lentisphaerae bacterium]|nr:Gfo/Idh/MocA family oxidoreductase [Lentisphaerota bacterium]
MIKGGENMKVQFSRRDLFKGALIGAGMAAVTGRAADKPPAIQGLDETASGADQSLEWIPYADRKVRVGIAGEGVCSFGSAFGYQSHPYVEVVACTDLDPAKCKLLQQRVKAQKTYPSCEEMIRHAAEDKLEAVYLATDAPSHVTLAIMALEHGLNVASAVPAFLGEDQLEYVPKLLEAVKRSGKLYQMNETSAFRDSCYKMRKLYEAGMFGAITYTEGEYFHPGDNKLDGTGTPSYNGWRNGLPPQYYPTHSNGYYTCVTHKRFTEVTCTGIPSLKVRYQKNRYNNPYGSEYAMFKCEDGSAARMLVAWDTPSFGGEDGRIWGQKGCFVPEKGGYRGWFEKEVKADAKKWTKRALPKGMSAGGHGGSHSYLTDDFIHGILVPSHKICVDVITALNTTVAGIYAHKSAMKGGEVLKIPEIKL